MIITSLEDDPMIYADPSEKEGLDKMKIPDNYKVNIQFMAQLEELTGADMLISALELPPAPAFIPEHIKNGAVLVQRKSGLDLPSSVGERMNTSLVRMRSTGARQVQCCLLFIGQILCDREGNAVIDGQKPQGMGDGSYWQIQGALSKWVERGGVVEQLGRATLVPGWLKIKEQHMKEFKREPVVTVYKSSPQMTEVDTNDPLQLLKFVKDWRTTLLSFPGLGPKKVEQIYEYMKKEGIELSLLQALILLMDFDSSIPGIGKGITKQIREWIGMPDNESQFSISYESVDKLKEIKET